MMMTEMAGMGSGDGSKGKAFNLMRQQSEDAVMTTFINNNNNNNNTTLEVDRSSPFSNHSGSNRSQTLDKGASASQLTMQMQVEEHQHNEDDEMDKRNPNYHNSGNSLEDNEGITTKQQQTSSSGSGSPPLSTVRQKSGGDGEFEMGGEESEDLTMSRNMKDQDQFYQHQQQQQHLNNQSQSNSNSMSDDDRGESRGGAEGEDDEGMMVMDEEGYSDDGEMPGDEDSDKDEHRITVREALMSRAYQAAAAAAKYGHGGGSRYSHTQSGGRPSSAGSPSNSPLIQGVNGHSHSRSQGGHHREYHHVREHHSHSHHGRHSNYPSSGGHHHHSQLSRLSYLGNEVDNFVKAERRSHPSSPVNCDLKPESLAGGENGLGNALLNHLASLGGLGGLAALQQSIPNFMANVVGHNNAPLNLTHPNARDLIPHHLSSHRNSPHNNNNNNNNGPGATGNLNNNPSSNLPLSPNSLIASAIANITGGSGGVGALPMSQGPQTSIPQLILASGHISQGIQGAQLLIPTSQGIMSQTVLTIPITQPGSPPNSSTPPQMLHHPNTGTIPSNANVPGGSSLQGNKRHQQLPPGGLPMSHRSMTHHPQSPSIASAAPQRSRESASPDYPQERARTLMGLGSHLVGQPMGGHMPTIPEKLALDHRNGSLNGVRNIHGKRESVNICPPKSSPCSIGDSIHDHDSDKFSDTEDDQMVDGINLDEIKEFAKAFKLRRLSLGLTQTQVGQALSVTEGPAYSQSAICSALAWQLASQSQSYPPSIHQQSMFEKLDITPKSAQKIKPVLERWMKEAEERYKNGHQNLNEFVGMEPSKKRKRRTSFTPQALEILNNHFERNTHPSGAEITTLAHQLGYEREVIRIWFCNKRQALKNTVRMMSKGSSPM